MWKPIHLDYILRKYDPLEARVLGSLTLWIICIFGAIGLSLLFLPDDWVTVQGDRNQLIIFFVFNPALMIGLLLLFWVGFEWAFIPVFMSMFIIGIFSHLPFYWSILFGLSYVFGLTIYAIVYHCLNISYGLKSLVSIGVFIVTSFVAATASSLGAFIWSLSHQLSASETAILWNGWWTGSLLQAIIIIGPLLFVFSPVVERYKRRWFELPEKQEVSTRWVYSVVIITTIVIAVFIYSGDYLAKQRIAEVISNESISSEELILQSVGSFETITWVSIWIIICVGLGAISLIGSWNTELRKKVKKRTSNLEEAEHRLQESLDEKVVLLQEIHHRVKNNLAVITALLDLQHMRTKDEGVQHLLSDAKSRVKSMAFVHETLYQTENFSQIELKSYVKRLCESVQSTYSDSQQQVQLSISMDTLFVRMEKAVHLGLILNELVVNAYKHAFDAQDSGKIEVSLDQSDGCTQIVVRDNGTGIPEDYDIMKSGSLGVTLIKTLAKQLHADLSYESKPGNTRFVLELKNGIVDKE